MVANMDTTDGVTSFVGREDAWHTLGTALGHSFTAEEAMKEGHLADWNVRKAPIFTVVGGKRIELQDRNAVVRDNPVRAGQIDVLGDVGNSYRIIQNEQHAALLNALVDESGANLNTAGALNGGRSVFITMELPGHINVGGVDPIKNFIAGINTHDGSMAFTLMVTPVQIVCENTLNLAFQNNSHMFRIRHTSGAENAIRTQAREALDMTFKYLDGFQQQAEQLINTTLTQTQFEEIVEKEFGAEEDASPAAHTRAERKIGEMVHLFADAATQESKRGTAWAGLGALTEWADHFSPTRGTDRDTARAQKSLLDPSFKNRALELMLAV